MAWRTQPAACSAGDARAREQTFVTPAHRVPEYPDLILDGLAAAARQAPGDADKF